MANFGFYSDNANRRFPFITTPAIEQLVGDRIPDNILLDCGLVFLENSKFEPDSQVWLSDVSITDVGDTPHLFLTFANSSTDVGHVALEFEVPITRPDFNIGFSEASGWTSEPITIAVSTVCYGYVVVGGDLTALRTFIADLKTPLKAKHTLEPALIQSLDNTYVSSVSVVNRARITTHTQNVDALPLIYNDRLIDGPLLFTEGHNISIGYNKGLNAMQFTVVAGGGAGYPCEEVKIYPEEVPPDGGSLLSGGPTCNEIMKTINGLPGPQVILKAGKGVRIEKDATDEHQLNILIDETLLSNCTVSNG